MVATEKTFATKKPAATEKPITTNTHTAKPTENPVVVEETVSYANCSPVRASGADPIYEYDPGYSLKLNRDGDDIGCE
ncbi:excalibur calcium-binding domain-containing protein [Paenibacillus sinopodophylli]|uniref:excalibur calcium-binding domain-containing protein n=1 Tax=Paenibacillus sinopodophylli TaxID=1837342 RepID=UPI001FE43FF6|nr:excalibur calcium-binding domain-containing protein [Paenibacillus sinopodophylli]